MQKAFRTHIDHTSCEQVYHLIANIAHYGSWLPNSRTFYGVRHVSDDPIKVGTTYTDGQGSLRMHGKVTALKPHEQIKFEQWSRFRLLGIFPAGMDIMVDYILVQEHTGTTVIRNYHVEFHGILRILKSRIIPSMKAENERILHVMKDVLEKNY